ncbi:MAG: carbon monoxide dehydrogenase, partial [Proteobacteria bacterium]|nr:carbon monoxide dehydrogenase [Pseudomonadota bacterium]MBU1610844.1 carbon monoxide dehydrogenase [Pseudomonadota bacterium]
LNRFDGQTTLPTLEGLPLLGTTIPALPGLLERQLTSATVLGLPEQDEVDRLVAQVLNRLG